jgi:hypothetical protein
MSPVHVARGIGLLAVALVACTRPAVQPAVAPPQPAQTGAEQAIAAERNPPGDIPDDQAFIPYTSGVYQVQVPEGWARTVNGTDVRFVDKFGGVAVTLSTTAQAPVAATPPQIPGRAVQIIRARDVRLPGGPAVVIDYASNSEPDSVTGKQIRLENQAYLFFKDGRLATLTMWAPFGADNVDQWNLMSRSFKWQ